MNETQIFRTSLRVEATIDEETSRLLQRQREVGPPLSARQMN